MDSRKKDKTWVYIIDEDFRVIYSNDETKHSISPQWSQQPCYQVICQEDSPCGKCPLRTENHGHSILFDRLHNQWINVSASRIDWPGVGKCHVILCDNVTSHDSQFYYQVADQADYVELLELNYLKDTYNVIYRGKHTAKGGGQSGSISAAVRRIAEKWVHPEDRERFCRFWLLSRTGTSGISEELRSPRHGEFRRLQGDGSYSWVQQILTPTRQNLRDTVFMMSFYNVINMPDAQNDYIDGGSHGLLNRQTFLSRAASWLAKAAPETEWCMIAIDLEKFKLFNEWSGREAGDRLLSGVAGCLNEFQERGAGIAGGFGDDDFVFLTRDNEDQISVVCGAVQEQIKQHCGKMNVLPAFGVYHIDDTGEAAYQMYDRAKLACSAVKGNYTTRIKRFEPAMLEAMQSELLLLTDIQNAFEKDEFTFYLQPKCNMQNGKIVGAEALARWISGEKGMVPPGVFIPFLENSGLISELDTYLWEEVCRWQRSMLDRGRKTVPVSVNISRIDICSVDVPAYFSGLIEKYDLDPKLIELEITESAYAEDITVINKIVTQLRERGFRVLMDDFGSAYSSLNMLKDLNLDVLKMDMRFLQLNGANAARGIDILETVCNMAHILGMGIIAEGVETEEQKKLLVKLGCSYGQGYYFYRPIPVAEFEAVAQDPEDVGRDYLDEAPGELFYLKDLLNKNILSQDMLSNMLGAVAFYDVCGEQITVARYNEQYADLLGDPANLVETSRNFGEQLYESESKSIFQMFNNAQKNRHTGAELDIHRRRTDGEDMWLHLRVFFLYQRDGHSVFYSTVSDVTEMHRSNDTLQFLNNDMPGGYYRHKNNPDGDFTHISQRFLDIFGYTRQEIREEFDDKFINMIHPEDRKTVQECIGAMEQTGGNYSQPCRMRSKNGYIFVLDQSRLVRFGDQEVFQGIILCDLDNYMWLKDDVNDKKGEETATTLMPCGVFRCEADGSRQFAYVSNSMLHLLGYSRQEFEKKFPDTEALIYLGDRDRITVEIAEQIKHGNFTACEYRVELADGSLKWVYSRGRLSTDARGKRWFYVCITDYDYLKQKFQVQEWQYLKYRSLVDIPGVIVYDYDPQSDQLTVEMTRKDGTVENVVAENYVENIHSIGFVDEAYMEEQRQKLLEASRSPVNKTTEFKGRFLPNQDFRLYRFHYTSLSDENGKVYRIVGRGEEINE